MKYEIAVPVSIREYDLEEPMVDIAGGMTAFPTVGKWRGRDGDVHVEAVDWLMFLVRRDDMVRFGLLLDDYVEKLLETQEAVLIGIDGEYVLVSEHGVEAID